jgi:uncharacterized protein YdaT
MPFTGQTFAKRHNKKLQGKTATKAADMANAMIKTGVPEGEAIATANKRAPAAAGRRSPAAARKSNGRVTRSFAK